MKTKREFTKSDIDEIIKLYTIDKIPMSKIAEIYKCGVKRIKECLINNNVEIVKGALNKLKDEIVDKAISLLDEGKSLTEASKILNCNRDALSRGIKAKGYKIINHQNQAKFDETIFDVIDTEEKAYWLGFIYADGYISSTLTKGKYQGKNPYAFGLALQLRDINHLIKFNNFTKHNKNNVRTDVKDPIRPHCR